MCVRSDFAYIVETKCPKLVKPKFLTEFMIEFSFLFKLKVQGSRFFIICHRHNHTGYNQ